MADLMFGLGQTKKKKETEAKVRNTKAHLKDVNITETVESNVRSDQHGREKSEKAKRTATKQHLRDVNITETVETNVRAEQFGREKNEKNVRAETKTNLRDINITDTVETDVRREQHSRDKEWKETGKAQKKSNTSFDMARALFNWGGISLYAQRYQFRDHFGQRPRRLWDSIWFWKIKIMFFNRYNILDRKKIEKVPISAVSYWKKKEKVTISAVSYRNESI